MREPASLADRAEGVRFVHVERSVVLLAEGAEAGEGRQVPVHREDGVGDDPGSPPVGSVLLEQRFEGSVSAWS